MTLDFDAWRASMVLEALKDLDDKWYNTVKGTNDEDVKADYGNDMIRLHILQEDFEYVAVREFGAGVTDFSREPVQITTPLPDEKSGLQTSNEQVSTRAMD